MHVSIPLPRSWFEPKNGWPTESAQRALDESERAAGYPKRNWRKSSIPPDCVSITTLEDGRF
jgi:hypothetical protein